MQGKVGGLGGCRADHVRVGMLRGGVPVVRTDRRRVEEGGEQQQGGEQEDGVEEVS